MVKIKEGYVMNAREKAEFDRVNALPRKTCGRVAYYYKPQTKYPPRIYVFMHSEIWQDRNRRPMGLFHSFPFLVRPMNSEEIEYHHFDTRLCYHQYEDWDKLLYAEEQEAERLDIENTRSGTAFLNTLKSFREKYPIGASRPTIPVIAERPAPNEETEYLLELLAKANEFTPAEVGQLLAEEQQGKKRSTILILLREMYKEAAGADNQLQTLTPEVIRIKADRASQRSRKNFVRRVFNKNPLFALEEIRERYPDYNEQALFADLKRKPRKPKAHKTKLVLDLRRVQLAKLASKLRETGEDGSTYHNICTRIVQLEEAHKLRVPIPIAVTFQKRTVVYYFHWQTRETVVKSFVDFANQKGQDHESVKARHQQITSSNYSF